MPSEVALVFFLRGYCLMQRHKKYNAQLLVMSKKLRTFALRNNSNLDSIEYQVMKSKTNKKNIMKKDEFVDLMRQQGCNAEAVDNDDVVLIPIYDGITDDHGCISQEMYRVPRAIAPDCNFIVRLADDSLANYRMHKGDELRMRKQDTAQSGEFVLAIYDGLPTVKIYFEDEDGYKWLVPGDETRDAMRINADHSCSIIGVATAWIKQCRAVSPEDCAKAVKAIRSSKK